MEIEFKKFSDYPRGTFYKLLKDAYSFESNYQKDCKDKWLEEDNFFYDNLYIADSCGFITTINNIPIGFICWDPRTIPEYIELGHNCIIEKFKGMGYGKKQLLETIRRTKNRNPKKIIVTTDELLVSAQKNYESVGFKFIGYRNNPLNNNYTGRLMDYELNFTE